MRDGKHTFGVPADSEGDFSLTAKESPDERSYLCAPSSHRRFLTERDKAHNSGVETLFNNLVPGLPIDTDPPEMRQDPQPLSLLIEKILKRLKIEESPWLNELIQAWPSLVPPEVAKETVPGKFDSGILYIYVSHPIKLFEIRRTWLKQIETRVQAFSGGQHVRQVRLMVNSVALP